MVRNPLIGAGVVALALVATACSSSPAKSSTGSGSSGTQAANGGSTPAQATSGFVQGILSPRRVPACDYVVPNQKLQCQAAMAGFHITGSGVSTGNTFVNGDQALVSLLARRLCTSALTQNGRSCKSNSDPNAGLPRTATGFPAAYAATFVAGRTALTAIPCLKVGGRWYVNLVAPTPGADASGASGSTSSSA
jgi:hypothetical protein